MCACVAVKAHCVDAAMLCVRSCVGVCCIWGQALVGGGYTFMYNDHLGYVHGCPTNCGTGMRASVHVRLPLVSSTPGFKAMCEALRVQARGEHGEHSDDSSGVFDISNKERLGKSEVQLVQTMIDGVRALIEEEVRLQGLSSQ